MILVTGGTGFIGGHLLEVLATAGEPLRCLVRPARRPRTLPPGVEIVAGDLATGDGLERALDGADAVIHLAGVTKALSPAAFYEGNTRATERLARAAAGRRLRFVHVSSLAAMGPSPDGTPLAEDAEPRPITHYGKSKLEAERVLSAVLPEAVIIRPPVVYGPRDTDVFQVLRSVARGLVIEISGGERWFSAIYVEDLARGLLAAARGAPAGGRYFLAHPKPVSWSELGAVAACIMGRRPRTLRVPFAVAYAAGWGAERWSQLTGTPGIVSREKVAEARCRWWTCDARRAAADFGFAAATGIEAGLARTLAWYKEAGWLNY